MRNGRQILAESSDFHAFFRDLLHAVNLRHGTDGFTSPPKEGVLRIFFRPENSDGFGRVRTRELGYKSPARYLLSSHYHVKIISCSVIFGLVFTFPKLSIMLVSYFLSKILYIRLMFLV